MTTTSKPSRLPLNPRFSSGPCSKRPGWSPDALKGALTGRSHRSTEGKARLALAIEKTRALLGLPDGYHVGIMPGSDTGAFEAAMWSLLGQRGVDVLAWEAFGKIWVVDILRELKIEDARALEGDYGVLPDLSAVDFSRDVVFTWNGTTAGVRVPNGDWIPDDRQGLTLVDATSAIFAQPIDWAKTDVVTYSWQKVLGGEGAHGVLILSPRAVERLESHVPRWPLPKLFRLTKKGKLDAAIFEGETINTPSMLCVEDYLDALTWAESVGGLNGLMARADANARVLFDWIERTPWVANLAVDPATWSNTGVCLKVVDPEIVALPGAEQAKFAKRIVARLEAEGAALDFGSYRDAPAGLRVWTGATVETTDVEALTPWLDWAFAEEKAAL
ncbi:MAG TPA: phosphoserine transaminase [Hyphomicrobium sp.]|nr:phosphoserine transaminase [Hyphomicrobium sp.]HRO49812.1 phosphoserine transaminase [Hyphomicrobium sp.]